MAHTWTKFDHQRTSCNVSGGRHKRICVGKLKAMSASQLGTTLVPAACHLQPATCTGCPCAGTCHLQPATCYLPPACAVPVPVPEHALCPPWGLAVSTNLHRIGQPGPGGLSQHPPPGGTECLQEKQARSDELLLQDKCMAKYAHVFPIRWSPRLPATHISWISPKFIISEKTSSKNSSKCLRICFSSTLCAPRQL